MAPKQRRPSKRGSEQISQLGDHMPGDNDDSEGSPNPAKRSKGRKMSDNVEDSPRPSKQAKMIGDVADNSEGWELVADDDIRVTRSMSARRFAPGPPYSKRDKSTYRRGQIVWVHIHNPNTNSSVQQFGPQPEKEGGGEVTPTYLGAVYSKARMAVVLWLFHRQMICLPMYTHGSRGIDSRPAEMKNEYMEITSLKRISDHNKKGPNDVLGAVMRARSPPLRPQSLIHLAGAFSVDYKEKVDIVGDVRNKSQDALMKAMKKLIDTAQQTNQSTIKP